MQIKCLPRALYINAYKCNHMELLNQPPEVSDRLNQLERFEQAVKIDQVSAVQAVLYVGVPVATIYRWRRRYQQEGTRGLSMCLAPVSGSSAAVCNPKNHLACLN